MQVEKLPPGINYLVLLFQTHTHPVCKKLHGEGRDCPNADPRTQRERATQIGPNSAIGTAARKALQDLGKS